MDFCSLSFQIFLGIRVRVRIYARIYMHVYIVFSSTFSLSFCFVLFSPVRERVLDFLEEVRMREEGGSRGEKGELWPEEN